MKASSIRKISTAAAAVVLSLAAFSKAATVPYSTSFETSEGYSTGLPLVPQNGWAAEAGENNTATATVVQANPNTGSNSVLLTTAGTTTVGPVSSGGTEEAPAFTDLYNATASSLGAPIPLAAGSFSDLNVSFAMNPNLGSYQTGSYTNPGMTTSNITNSLVGVDIFDSNDLLIAGLLVGQTATGLAINAPNFNTGATGFGSLTPVGTSEGFSGPAGSTGGVNGIYGTYTISVDPTAGTFTVGFGGQSFTGALPAGYSGSIGEISLAAIDQGIAGGANFDDLSITTSAPEPTSVAMIGLGGLLLLAKRPKKQLA